MDFEPFRDGEFVDSELGPIPKGWRVGKIDEHFFINSGQYTGKEGWKHLHYLDTGSITNNAISSYQLFDCLFQKIPSRAKRLLRDRSIVYSTVRPNQRHFGLILSPPDYAVASTGFVTIQKGKSSLPIEYAYLFLTTNEVIAKLQQIAETTQSTFPACRPNDISSLKLTVPDEETSQKFFSTVGGLYKAISQNNAENHTLAALRDALLPKLMSGEIDVSNVKT